MKLANKTVLIVDDFQSMRSTLRQTMMAIGFEQITSVATGEEALAALRAKRFDIILCDYNLGDGLDGQQVLDQGRSEGLISLGTVFVMVTAEKSSEMVMGALESEPDAYLSKPFTKDLLNARLERALHRRAPLLPVAHKLKTKGPGAALRELDALFLRAPANRLELLRLRAELAFMQGDLAKAETACHDAMADKPLAWALTQLGQIAERHGEWPTAEAQYRKSIVLTPHFMAAHDRLANLCELQGRLQDALEILVAALERSPKSLARQRHLGRLATQLGRDDLAESAWRRVIAMARQMGTADAADYLQLIRALVRRGDAREAEQSIQALSQRCRHDVQLHYWLLAARIHAQQQMNEATQAALWSELEALLARAPVPERPGIALAEAVALQGNISQYPPLVALHQRGTRE
jgi:DNA-binding response OmpR family regulator